MDVAAHYGNVPPDVFDKFFLALAGIKIVCVLFELGNHFKLYGNRNWLGIKNSFVK